MQRNAGCNLIKTFALCVAQVKCPRVAIAISGKAYFKASHSAHLIKVILNMQFYCLIIRDFVPSNDANYPSVIHVRAHAFRYHQ